MKHTILLALLLTLSACTAAQDGTVRALDDVQDNTGKGVDKVRDLLNLGHAKPVVDNTKPQDRYCYQVYQDIVCYDHPLYGSGENMTGYQNKEGKVGYQLENNQPLSKLSSVNVSSAPGVKSSGDSNSRYMSAATNTSPATTKKPPQQGLHEIIFDASELQPKDLVSTKPPQ